MTFLFSISFFDLFHYFVKEFTIKDHKIRYLIINYKKNKNKKPELEDKIFCKSIIKF